MSSDAHRAAVAAASSAAAATAAVVALSDADTASTGDASDDGGAAARAGDKRKHKKASPTSYEFGRVTYTRVPTEPLGTFRQTLKITAKPKVFMRAGPPLYVGIAPIRTDGDQLQILDEVMQIVLGEGLASVSSIFLDPSVEWIIENKNLKKSSGTMIKERSMYIDPRDASLRKDSDQAEARRSYNELAGIIYCAIRDRTQLHVANKTQWIADRFDLGLHSWDKFFGTADSSKTLNSFPLRSESTLSSRWHAPFKGATLVRLFLLWEAIGIEDEAVATRTLVTDRIKEQIKELRAISKNEPVALLQAAQRLRGNMTPAVKIFFLNTLLSDNQWLNTMQQWNGYQTEKFAALPATRGYNKKNQDDTSELKAYIASTSQKMAAEKAIYDEAVHRVEEHTKAIRKAEEEKDSAALKAATALKDQAIKVRTKHQKTIYGYRKRIEEKEAELKNRGGSAERRPRKAIRTASHVLEEAKQLVELLPPEYQASAFAAAAAAPIPYAPLSFPRSTLSVAAAAGGGAVDPYDSANLLRSSSPSILNRQTRALSPVVADALGGGGEGSGVLFSSPVHRPSQLSQEIDESFQLPETPINLLYSAAAAHAAAAAPASAADAILPGSFMPQVLQRRRPAHTHSTSTHLPHRQTSPLFTPPIPSPEEAPATPLSQVSRNSSIRSVPRHPQLPLRIPSNPTPRDDPPLPPSPTSPYRDIPLVSSPLRDPSSGLGQAAAPSNLQGEDSLNLETTGLSALAEAADDYNSQDPFNMRSDSFTGLL